MSIQCATLHLRSVRLLCLLILLYDVGRIVTISGVGRSLSSASIVGPERI